MFQRGIVEGILASQRNRLQNPASKLSVFLLMMTKKLSLLMMLRKIMCFKLIDDEKRRAAENCGSFFVT